MAGDVVKYSFNAKSDKTLGQKIKRPKIEKEETENTIITANELVRGVYVFASFDICASTAMKFEYDNWSEVLQAFIVYGSKSITSMKFWKFNGDELLFQCKVYSVSEIMAILDEVYDAIAKYENHFSKQSSDIDVKIKAALWISYLSCISSTKKKHRVNIPFIYTESGLSDYAGRNIDEGFRMSKHANQDKLVVDPKIVMLIYLTRLYLEKDKAFDRFIQDDTFFQLMKKETNKKKLSEDARKIVDDFRIIGYKSLKGVWKNRLYPIIWYIKDWDNAFEERLGYDETFGDERLSLRHKKDFETVKALEKVFDHIDFRNDIREIASNLRLPRKPRSKEIPTSRKAYIYYIVVCVVKSGTDYYGLLFKRGINREHLPGVWEFGSVKHTSEVLSVESAYDGDNESFSLNEHLKVYYRNKFGIDIEDPEPVAFTNIFRFMDKRMGIVLYSVMDIGELPINEFENKVNEYIKEKYIDGGCAEAYEGATLIKLSDIASGTLDGYEELSMLDTAKDSEEALKYHNLDTKNLRQRLVARKAKAAEAEIIIHNATKYLKKVYQRIKS